MHKGHDRTKKEIGSSIPKRKVAYGINQYIASPIKIAQSTINADKKINKRFVFLLMTISSSLYLLSIIHETS
jgi:hypothetical protein